MLCTAYLTTCRNDKMHTLGTNLRFLLNVRCSSGNRWPAWPYFSLSLLSMWPLSAHAVAQWRITFFCNRGDTYYSITAGSRKGSLATIVPNS